MPIPCFTPKSAGPASGIGWLRPNGRDAARSLVAATEILDTRVLTKQYGKVSLKALPPCRMEIV
jgi:hypothetical protein